MIKVRIPHRDIKTERIGPYSVIMVRKEHGLGEEPAYELIVREGWQIVYRLHDATLGAVIATYERAVPILEIEVAKEAMGRPTKRLDLCASLTLFPSNM